MSFWYHDVILVSWHHSGIMTSFWYHDVILVSWHHSVIMTSFWYHDVILVSWHHFDIMIFWYHFLKTDVSSCFSATCILFSVSRSSSEISIAVLGSITPPIFQRQDSSRFRRWLAPPLFLVNLLLCSWSLSSPIFEKALFVAWNERFLFESWSTMSGQFQRHKIKQNFPRHWNTGLVSNGVSLTSWEEGASLALVGHPSRDGITIKIPYLVDVLLHRPALHPIFSYWVG